jgi:hypothetical protein
MPREIRGSVSGPVEPVKVGDVVVLQATATLIEDDQPPKDISAEIAWRRPVAGRGPSLTLALADRRNPAVAAYARGEHVGTHRLDIKPKCDALDPASGHAPPTADERVLARLIMGEGATAGGGTNERRAIGYTVVNRRAYTGPPPRYPSTIRGVVEQKDKNGNYQYTSVGDPRNHQYKDYGDDRYVRNLEKAACDLFKEALRLAREILADTSLGGDPIAIAAHGKHGYFINQATGDDPDSFPNRTHPAWTPRVRKAGQGGWTHSFYTIDIPKK